MALTLSELAVHARLSTDPTAAVPEPYSSILTRLQAAAVVEIDSWAEDAPEAVQDLATIAVVSYAFDRPTAYRRMAFADVFTNCGARAMLANWHIPVVEAL